jgi:hypothetical protein
MLSYEEKLDRDLGWALHEGGLYFECRSQLHLTLRRFAKVMNDAVVDYALVGTVAMFFHGFRRFAERIDVILSPAELEHAFEICAAHGFVRTGVEHYVRDVETGVKITFLVNGRVPRIYGLPELKIPSPHSVSLAIDGLRVVTLETQITMKLNSGQARHRLKDLADVQSLIQHCGLAPDFADQLDPSLRDAYRRIWTDAQTAANDEY